MRDMWDILRESSVRELVADLIALIALCVLLYAMAILGAGLVP